MSASSAVFLIHLIQDVNVLRPLIFMAARDFQFGTLLLVHKKFLARDLLGIWLQELEAITRETGARLYCFDDHWDAHRELKGKGLLFSASESDVPNHSVTHGIFKHAPAGYLRVTLQHGFECVGFRHSADHINAYGNTASFAADLLCTWAELDQLPSLASSQRPKAVVTGPSFVIQQQAGRDKKSSDLGLICENLHSVRFAGLPKARADFVNTLSEFSKLISAYGKSAKLRPHPGGQYYLKNGSALPPNVTLEVAPAYRLNFREYAYGISAPSSVLIEMIVAGIPTAVWRDSDGHVDADAYQGLTMVRTAAEWVEFARSASTNPELFLIRQAEFLKRSGMLQDTHDVYRRFAKLFQSGARLAADGTR